MDTLKEIEYIRDMLPYTEILAQWMEECAELIQAMNKVRRATMGMNPTLMSFEEAVRSMAEEYIQCTACAVVTFGEYGAGQIGEGPARFIHRWAERLREADKSEP